MYMRQLDSHLPDVFPLHISHFCCECLLRFFSNRAPSRKEVEWEEWKCLRTIDKNRCLTLNISGEKKVDGTSSSAVHEILNVQHGCKHLIWIHIMESDRERERVAYFCSWKWIAVVLYTLERNVTVFGAFGCHSLNLSKNARSFFLAIRLLNDFEWALQAAALRQDGKSDKIWISILRHNKLLIYWF